MQSLLASLTRLIAKSNSRFLSVRETDVVELSSYHYDDVFQGVLLRYNASENKTKEKYQLETWFKLPSHFKVFDKKNGQFLQNVQVTSDFDVKESVSRNFLGSLGLFSDVIIMYTLSPEQNYNLTFLVVDPAGQLAQVLDVKVDEKTLSKTVTGSAKASIPLPLLPGVWEVKVYHDGFLIAGTEFLVIPVEFIGSTSITSQQASLLHRGSHEYRISAEKIHWTKSLDNGKSKHSIALANQKRIGIDLKDWIDSLTKKFYTLVETCQATSGRQMSKSLMSIEPCEATIWSSLSPDLKSRIAFYDPSSGTIS